MRRLSERGEALIKSFETLQLKAYKHFSSEPWTCGWGHTGPDVGPTTTCDETKAEQWFQGDVVTAEHACDMTLPMQVTQNQFDAMVSFTFNVGVSTESHSTLLRLVIGGQMELAADEFLKWCHVAGQIVPGLLRRRQAERELFLTPDSE